MPRPPRLREPKACRPCAYAKVKCEPHTVGGCKRCLRLQRECTMQAPGAHKQKSQRSPADVARLAERVENVTVLVATPPQNGQDASTRGPSGNPRHYGSPPPQTNLPFDQHIIPNGEHSGNMLNIFRTKMVLCFPFVVIPWNMTVSDLVEQKPFLFRTIMMVTSLEDTPKQLSLVSMVREDLCRSILVQGQKSLDLLQALLVCLAWHHLQHPPGPQFSSLAHLAFAMMFELGLHKKPSQGLKKMAGVHHIDDHRIVDKYRSLEERRTYLGCLYINSAMTMCLWDMDPMRYTEYTEECIDAIKDAAEYPSDILLIHLARLHRITDKIKRTLVSDETQLRGLMSSTPVGLWIRSLGAELRQLKQTASPKSHQDAICLMHYHTIELYMYRIALEDDYPIEKYGNYSVTRLNLLFSCLTSLKSFFDTFSRLSALHYWDLGYPVYLVFTHAVEVASKILLFKHEGWDQQYARRMVDLPLVVNMFIDKTAEAIEARCSVQHLNRLRAIFDGLISKLRELEDIYEPQGLDMPSEAARAASSDTTTSAPEHSIRDTMFQLPHDMSWQFLSS